MSTSEIIALASVIFAFIFALISEIRASKRDTKNDAVAISTLNSDIGYVKSGIDDIKQKQNTTEDKLSELTIKVTNADSSAKSAHHRLDMHEARLVKIEHEKNEHEGS